MCDFIILKNEKNSKIEEIGLVTSTKDLESTSTIFHL